MNEKIKCEICGYETHRLINKHFKLHNLTKEKYLELYPNANIISDSYSNTISNYVSKANKIISERLKEKSLIINLDKILEKNKNINLKEFQCIICFRVCKNKENLSKHTTRAHGIKQEDLILKIVYNDITPLCKCGCGKKVNMLRGKFCDYLWGHRSKISSGFPNNFNLHGLNKGALKSIENRRNKTYEELYGIEKAKEMKIKKREDMIKRLEDNGVNLSMNVGNNEKQLLNEQEIKDNCKIDRNFRILGYCPDGYCHETNTIYEVYEKCHDKSVFEDLERENEICKKLSCNFIIIYDRTH